MVMVTCRAGHLQYVAGCNFCEAYLNPKTQEEE